MFGRKKTIDFEVLKYIFVSSHLASFVHCTCLISSVNGIICDCRICEGHFRQRSVRDTRAFLSRAFLAPRTANVGGRAYPYFIGRPSSWSNTNKCPQQHCQQVVSEMLFIKFFLSRVCVLSSVDRFMKCTACRQALTYYSCSDA